MIKCKILVPKKFNYPVLPIKKDKLIFTLCAKGFDEKCNSCSHNDKERALLGTWTTDEVFKAVEKGYLIKKIYEVWHFKEKSNNLFKEYVKDFMEIKLETSPLKDDFETIRDDTAAIKSCLDIDLDPENVAPKPGKRAVAKICLNSLWGKFGQRQNMTQTEYVSDVKRWYQILLDDRLEISKTIFINENMVQVTFKYKNEYVQDNFSTNVYVAAFTTSNTRLRLYDMLDKLGQSVAYYDTDSIVYIDNGETSVKTGCMLGEWTDELGKDNYIKEWFSTGPKIYGYLTNTGKEVVKIKGFTLNYENSEHLKIECMKRIIEKEIDKVHLSYKMITRNVKDKTLVNTETSKEFRFDYDKRMVMPEKDNNIETLPWGY